MSAVRVDAPSRLHLGFFPTRTGVGAAALSIDRPRLGVTLRPSDDLRVADREGAGAEEVLRLLIDRFDLGPGVHATVDRSIPRHRGLGSGSRLVLGLASGLCRLRGERRDLAAIARGAGRARTSVCGLTTFLRGGLAADLGSGEVRSVPVPPEWALLLVIPGGPQGLHGGAERAVMESLRPPATGTGALGEALAASAAEGDFRGFAKALDEIDRWTGRYFSEAQGGPYSSPVIAEGIARLRRAGAAAAGQSSWGPAFYGLFADPSAAERALSAVSGFVAEARGSASVVRPENRPAWVDDPAP